MARRFLVFENSLHILLTYRPSVKKIYFSLSSHLKLSDSVVRVETSDLTAAEEDIQYYFREQDPLEDTEQELVELKQKELEREELERRACRNE